MIEINVVLINIEFQPNGSMIDIILKKTMYKFWWWNPGTNTQIVERDSILYCGDLQMNSI